MTDRSNRFDLCLGTGWDYCHMCGKPEFQALIYFKDANAEPVAGETITGATSGASGVVEDYELLEGAWDGTGQGYIYLSSPQGYNRRLLSVFEDGESLNGSVSGSGFAVADGDGSLLVNGLFYPLEDLCEHEGKRYCPKHITLFIGDDDLPDIGGTNET